MSKRQDKWNIDNITDQNGRIAIVTGSSSGIGYEAANALAAKGARVIFAVRNQEKGEAAINRILTKFPAANVHMMHLDLADLESVGRFAETFLQQYNRLDLLINNAGVMIPPYSKTKNGFELQFGTNHLGHFALTGRLFDLIVQTPESRIVNVASSAHRYGNIDFDDLNWEKRRYKAWRAYGDSKIANLYFTYHLADLVEKAGLEVKVVAAHPGWSATELQRFSKFLRFLNAFFGQSAFMGALPMLCAATDPQANNGDYYGPGGLGEWRGYPVKVASNKLSQDRKIAARLWQLSEEITGVKEEWKLVKPDDSG